MRHLTIYDRIYKHMFDDKDQTKLSTRDYEVKQRVQTLFTKKLDHPTITDKQLVKFIVETFDVSTVTAYHDINGIEMIFGDIRKANKEYIRMIVTETQKTVINIEKDRIQKDMQKTKPSNYSTKDLTQAVSVLARANNLDKEDPNMPNWDEVQPPIIEPTDDITIMDLDAVPDENVERLKAKYLGKMSEIQEANQI